MKNINIQRINYVALNDPPVDGTIDEGDIWPGMVETQQPQPGVSLVRVTESSLGKLWPTRYYSKSRKTLTYKAPQPRALTPIKGSNNASSSNNQKMPDTSKNAAKLYNRAGLVFSTPEAKGATGSPRQRPSHSPAKRRTTSPTETRSLSPSQMPLIKGSAAPTPIQSVPPTKHSSEMPSAVATIAPSQISTMGTLDLPSLSVCQCDINGICSNPPPALGQSDDLRLCFILTNTLVDVDNNNDSLLPVSVERMQLEQTGLAVAIVDQSQLVKTGAHWSCNNLDYCMLSTPLVLEFFNLLENGHNSSIVARGTFKSHQIHKANSDSSLGGEQQLLRNGFIATSVGSPHPVAHFRMEFSIVIELEVTPPAEPVVVSDQLMLDFKRGKKLNERYPSKWSRVIAGTFLVVFLSGAIAYYFRKNP
jgi:hypothetical protein